MGKTRLFIRPNAVNRFGTTSIYIRYSHNDSQIDYSTNEMIEPRFWDSRLQQVKKSFKGHSGINNYLQEFKSKMDDLKRQLQMKGIEPTVKNFKEAYLKQNSPQQTETKSPYALDYWEQFIKFEIETKRIVKGTQVHYKASYNVLKDFETFTSTRIEFRNLDNNLYNKLLFYLYESRDNNPNTVSGRIKHLKCLCEWAVDTLQIQVNPAYKKYIRPSCESFSVSLSREQLDKIYLADLSDSKKLCEVRDLFIIGCASAFRYSDFKELTPAHIKANHIVKFVNKTKSEIKVPLNAYSQAVISKYNGVLPKAPAKFNKLLKEVAKRAGLTEMVEVITMPGGRVKKEQKEFYKLVASHVARRSWATQSVANGVSIPISMKITGHKTPKEFLKYIKNTEQAIDSAVTKAWNTLPTNEDKKENQTQGNVPARRV